MHVRTFMEWGKKESRKSNGPEWSRYSIGKKERWNERGWLGRIDKKGEENLDVEKNDRNDDDGEERGEMRTGRLRQP